MPRAEVRVLIHAGDPAGSSHPTCYTFVSTRTHPPTPPSTSSPGEGSLPLTSGVHTRDIGCAAQEIFGYINSVLQNGPTRPVFAQENYSAAARCPRAYSSVMFGPSPAANGITGEPSPHTVAVFDGNTFARHGFFFFFFFFFF